MEKKVIDLTIFLIKENVYDYEECVKNVLERKECKLKQDFGLEGMIYYDDSSSKAPKWKSDLDKIAIEELDMKDNTSNKAVLLVRIAGRIMAVVFGYGRTLLKEECIVRNFGLRVALNIIDQTKMRSVDAATIENTVVNTQRQTTYNTSQDEFGLSTTSEIMKGIAGVPREQGYGNHISGRDSLTTSVLMNIYELKEKLTLYYKAYLKDDYKNNGFEWVDNIEHINDPSLLEKLNDKLCDMLKKHNIDNMHMAPPTIVDWNRITGFLIDGSAKRKNKKESYSVNINLSEYVETIPEEKDILSKIKSNKVYAMDVDGNHFPLTSVYNALVYQTEHDNITYMLCDGFWYKIEESFCNRVNDFIQKNVKKSKIILPECGCSMHEGEYNEEAVKNNEDFCLMDKKMTSVLNGPKKIEACDIFTKDKQFIHVKNKGQSAQLSHLFAQGRVSAECFIDDEEFRKQVAEVTEERFGKPAFDYSAKVAPNEYEVIYAIIDDKDTTLVDKLPFFSKVNLMLTIQGFERMHMNCSVCLVKRMSEIKNP